MSRWPSTSFNPLFFTLLMSFVVKGGMLIALTGSLGACVVGDPNAERPKKGFRSLSPVADYQEDDYVPRSRPKHIEFLESENVLYVSLSGNLIDPESRVLALDAETGDQIASIEVGLSPQGMTFNSDRSKLYVTNQFSNFISVIDTKRNVETSRIKVSYLAQDVVIRDESLYLSNRWLDAIEVVALTSYGQAGDIFSTIPVGTNPRDLVFGTDGLLYVGNLAGTSISIVDTTLGREVDRVFTNSPINGLAVSGPYLFAASLGQGDGHSKEHGSSSRGDYRGDGTASTGFADVNNDLLVIANGASVPSFRYTSDTAEVSHADAIDDFLPGQMIVRGALPEQVVAMNNKLYVSMSASDSVQIFSIDPSDGSLTPEGNLDTGINPFELVVSADGKTVFTADRLGETISKIDVATNERIEWNVSITQLPYPATVYEQGEMLFHSARFSSEAMPSTVFPNGDKAGDKSCNHCHRETLTDGKVWSVGVGLLVPEGGQRIPPAARNLRDTQPLFWEGVQSEHDFDLEVNEFSPPDDFGCDAEMTEEEPESCVARDEFFRKQTGHDFEEVATEIIGQFLIGRPRMLPNPTSQTTDQEMQSRIKRGQDLFTSLDVGCANCHPLPGDDLSDPFTNNQNLGPVIPASSFDNGLQFKTEIDGNFNTPSLRGVWDRPTVFFHDGRAKSLRSAILGDGHPSLVDGRDGCQMLADNVEQFVEKVVQPVANGRGCNVVIDGIQEHGNTEQLSPAEVSDLLFFVESLQ